MRLPFFNKVNEVKDLLSLRRIEGIFDAYEIIPEHTVTLVYYRN